MLPSPMELYSMTPCHPLHLVASHNPDSRLGRLEPHDDHIDHDDDNDDIDHDDTMACTASDGISVRHPSATLRSRYNLTRLQQEDDDDDTNRRGWSVALWITPMATATTSNSNSNSSTPPTFQPILSVGPADAPVSHRPPLDGGCDNYEWLVARYGHHLVISFVDDADNADSNPYACRMIVLRQYTLVDDVPVVLTLSVHPKTGTSSIYLQDQVLLEDIPYVVALKRNTNTNANTNANTTTNSNHPSRPSYLHVFPTVVAHGTNVFAGSVQQVALYDQSLSPDQVAATVRAGRIPAAAVAPLWLQANTVPDRIVLEQQHDDDDNANGSVQDEETTLLWLGGHSNRSTAILPLSIQLQSRPFYGELYRVGSDEALPNTTEIPRNATGLWVEYRRRSNNDHSFFTIPTLNARGQPVTQHSESFQYRIAALGWKTALALSDVVTQPIDIVHVNHAPVWKVPSAVPTNHDNHHQNDYHQNDNGPDLEYNFGTIALQDDRDRDMNRVRIQLSVSHGRLSLRHYNSTMADFASCDRRSYSAWQCTSRNAQNAGHRTLNFVALPSDVSAILQDLHYEPFGVAPTISGSGATTSSANAATPLDDTLVLQAFDGAGGDCLDPREHAAWQQQFGPPVTTNTTTTNTTSTSLPIDTTTIHRTCFHVQTNVSLPSHPTTAAPARRWLDYVNLNPAEFGTADLVFWVVVLLCLYCCCSCWRDCGPSCLARGAHVVPDDFDSDDMEVLSETDESSSSSSSSSNEDTRWQEIPI